MTIYFATDNPEALLEKFTDLIEQSEQEGKIKTWEQYGGGFRHTAAEVKDFGVFKHRIIANKDGNKWLAFDFNEVGKPKRDDLEYAYAYFHGHLLQAFIVHLNKHFDRAAFKDRRG